MKGLMSEKRNGFIIYSQVNAYLRCILEQYNHVDVTCMTVNPISMAWPTLFSVWMCMFEWREQHTSYLLTCWRWMKRKKNIWDNGNPLTSAGTYMSHFFSFCSPSSPPSSIPNSPIKGLVHQNKWYIKRSFFSSHAIYFALENYQNKMILFRYTHQTLQKTVYLKILFFTIWILFFFL